MIPVLVASIVLLAACHERPSLEQEPSGTVSAAPAEPAASTPVPAPAPAQDAGVPPLVRVSELAPEIPPDACPEGMRHVPGGEYWMGSPRGRGAREERPRFQTRTADFCMDTHEVSVQNYARCVEQGRCSVPHGVQSTCNYGRRDSHPVNCVDHRQAEAYCAWRGARLPSELEWEYAARGGALELEFPWGSDPPDGRTCWKSSTSCPVGSFAAGVFELFDMSGNVWEWTADWYGDYPWPEQDGRSKVFRGGSWSRRFEKWMRPTLRNRTDPDSWGSHLGFRCARLAKNAECPFGEGSEPGMCRHGVMQVECADRKHQWNGWRCAPPGSPPCREGYAPVPGRGCVAQGRAAQQASAAGDDQPAEDREPPSFERSPEHDPDCEKNQPSKPHAYLLKGSTHAGRNAFGRTKGCKNRDVGVGWNSACCP